MIRAYLKRLFCQPATEGEYIAECDRICRKMTGRALSELPPWNFSFAFEDSLPPKDAVKEMVDFNSIMRRVKERAAEIPVIGEYEDDQIGFIYRLRKQKRGQ